MKQIQCAPWAVDTCKESEAEAIAVDHPCHAWKRAWELHQWGSGAFKWLWTRTESNRICWFYHNYSIYIIYIYNYIYIPYHDKYHQIDWCKSVLPHVSVQMLRLGTVSPGASYDTYDTPTKGIEVPPPFPSPNAFSTEGRVRISLVCGSMGPNVHAHSTWDAQQLGARLTISSSDRMNPIPSAVPSAVAKLNITYTYEMKSRDGKSQREEKSRKEKIREEKESEERRCRCAKR